MLGQNDYLTGVQNFIQAGIAHLQQLQAQGDAKAAGGITNLKSSTRGNVNFASSLPAQARVPLDLSKAQAAFISTGKIGWYPGSVQSGDQAALAYLQSIAAVQQTSPAVLAATSQAVAGASSPVSTSAVTVAGQSFTTGEVLIGLALIGGLIYFAM